jgi:hypothetical protein
VNYPLVHEHAHTTLILDFNELLAPIGGESNLLESVDVEKRMGRFTLSFIQATKMKYRWRWSIVVVGEFEIIMTVTTSWRENPQNFRGLKYVNSRKNLPTATESPTFFDISSDRGDFLWQRSDRD